MTTDAEALRDTHVPFSIRVLRRFNWLLLAILRSPLHGALSRDLLQLSYRGRRSGRSLALPLSYADGDGRIYLCTRTSRWWHNLRDGQPVEIVLRGACVRVRPTVLDSTDPEALEGLRLFVTKHPRTGAQLYAVPRGPHGPRPADLAREVRRSTVVRLEPLTISRA
jgi:hypothetical protein